MFATVRYHVLDVEIDLYGVRVAFRPLAVDFQLVGLLLLLCPRLVLGCSVANDSTAPDITAIILLRHLRDFDPEY